MSKSYKKHPVCKDGRRASAKQNRTRANRLIRRRFNQYINSSAFDSEDNSFTRERAVYQKETPSWDIWDYVRFETENDARNWYRKMKAESDRYIYYEKMMKKYPTEDDYIKHWWEVYYYRK